MAPKELTTIYVLECAGYFKVGFSKRMGMRMGSYRLHNPLPLRIVVREKVPSEYARRLELMAHASLRDFHHQGEWFSAPEEAVRAAITEAIGHISAWRELDRQRDREGKENEIRKARIREESVKLAENPPPQTLAQIRKRKKEQMLRSVEARRVMRYSQRPW